MDPLEVMEHLHKVKPVYHPIVSASKYEVIGHELYGMYGDDHRLDHFFRDSEVPDEFKVEVQKQLLEDALDAEIENEDGTYLFIHRSARHLLEDDEETLLRTLSDYEEKGFSMDRLVIEVMEHDFEEDFEALHHLLLYYKTFGIKIAVQHSGASSSNIDLIRQLQPHILKIDARLIRNHYADGLQDIMYTLQLLARRIGAALLFENISESFELQIAWKYGADYYQGNYLAEPEDHLKSATLRASIEPSISGFIKREQKLIEKRLQFLNDWEKRIKNLLPKWEGEEKPEKFLSLAGQSFNEESFRIFLCNENGKQISSNLRKRKKEWKQEETAKDSNWAFRPYFLENVMLMKTWGRGLLSDTYADIETKELIRTFSFPVSKDCFIFIDISYSYIFDNECLLT
ncbi:EAL domain-containing protein [Salimicrobium halophilum]|uniref:EAL domain, c-di-GMP-specific phosphodiesterase class I (Or its enzymatically inactive variant) n=1 Tax=Salimicrobium halophilum TaxID=86666 RepID=A0A1G8VLI8_9BACI|nr:EAL domain-containing protein [Salimicrobium halophilum]SDJ66829.1 EAL domain, c-di-GMP-specific phosphodiesterase class I (or its enzymatically inactive variant) [Salimicrobium halophilum]